MYLEAVFRYRTLMGKCELGLGLDWDEIDQVAIIEQAFAPVERTHRKFRREGVRLEAILRGDQLNDNVHVIEIGPGGLVLSEAPYVARGEQVELVFEDGDRMLRFRAEGVWIRDEAEDYTIGLRFVGMPVCVRKTAISAHEADLVDKITAAAA